MPATQPICDAFTRVLGQKHPELYNGCCAGLAITSIEAWESGRFAQFQAALTAFCEAKDSPSSYSIDELKKNVVTFRTSSLYDSQDSYQRAYKKNINTHASPALKAKKGIKSIHKIVGHYNHDTLASHFELIQNSAGKKPVSLLLSSNLHLIAAIWTGSTWIVIDSLQPSIQRCANYQLLRDKVAVSFHGQGALRFSKAHSYNITTTLINSSIKVPKQYISLARDNVTKITMLELAVSDMGANGLVA